MTDYVAGFLHDGIRVVLVRKKKPEWQYGKLNAVGGKIEPGEDARQAMSREFLEETGVHIAQKTWRKLLTLTDETRSFNVEFFTAWQPSQILDQCRTMEDEQICLLEIRDLFGPGLVSHRAMIPNLTWILPLALYRHDVYRPFMVKEHRA